MCRRVYAFASSFRLITERWLRFAACLASQESQNHSESDPMEEHMTRGRSLLRLATTVVLTFATTPTQAQEKSIVVASTLLLRIPDCLFREGQRPLLQGDRSGHGRRAEHRFGLERLPAVRSRHWTLFKNRDELDIAVQCDKPLFNQYGVILVNPAKHPHVKKNLGQAFIDWLVSDEGQRAIVADYKIEGQQLFSPGRHSGA